MRGRAFALLPLCVSGAIFSPNSPLLPSMAVIAYTSTPEGPVLPWASAPLRSLPASLGLEGACPPFRLSTCFGCARSRLGCLYFKAPVPSLLAFRPRQTPPLFTTTDSTVRPVRREPSGHVNGEMNFLLLPSFSCLLSLTSGSSLSTLLLAHLVPSARAPSLFQKGTRNAN